MDDETLSGREQVPPATEQQGDAPAPPPMAQPEAPQGGSTKPSRMWKTWQLITAALVALLVGIGIGSATKSTKKSATSGSATNTTEQQSATPDTSFDTTPETEPATTISEPPTTVAPRGTKDHPLPLGASSRVGDWTVTVVSFQADATAAVRAANQFNDAPPAGEAYSLIHLRETYNGDSKGSPTFGTSVAFVGTDARSYADSDCGAVVAHSMNDQPDVFKGGKVEGDVCIKAPLAVTSRPGAISVEASLSFGSEPTWWAST